jgi:hypothetical protein
VENDRLEKEKLEENESQVQMEYEEEILENEKSKLLENITNSQKRNMAFL